MKFRCENIECPAVGNVTTSNKTRIKIVDGQVSYQDCICKTCKQHTKIIQEPFGGFGEIVKPFKDRSKNYYKKYAKN